MSTVVSLAGNASGNHGTTMLMSTVRLLWSFHGSLGKCSHDLISGRWRPQYRHRDCTNSVLVLHSLRSSHFARIVRLSQLLLIAVFVTINEGVEGGEELCTVSPFQRWFSGAWWNPAISWEVHLG